MSESYVLDTHTLFWHQTSPDSLGTTARDILDRPAAADVTFIVAAITVAELYYLCEKKGEPLELGEYLQELRSAGVKLVPFEAGDTLLFDDLSSIPEMHDRIIAGVALTHDATLLTRDPKIRACEKVRAIW